MNALLQVIGLVVIGFALLDLFLTVFYSLTADLVESHSLSPF